MSKFEFSNLLHRLIDQSDLSKKTLAEKAGLSRSSLYNLLNGDVSEAKLKTLINLSVALDIHPLELIRPYFNCSVVDNTCSQITPGLGSGFVGDVTFPDYSVVYTGQVFQKVWSVMNTGNTPWEGLYLACQDEPFMVNGKQTGLRPKVSKVPISYTEPSEKALIVVEFTAPELPCTVQSEWKAVNAEGELILSDKSPLYCIVKVVGL